MKLPTYTATRYAVPLREGGSLPAILDTDGGGLFVAKFRGAGQGARALLAELIVGLLAQHLGLPVPELALIHLDPAFGRTERDPEIQDLLQGSRGLNIGLRYLDGAFNYDPLAAASFVTPARAADIVWLDAYVTNIDRTARNPNLMIWQRGLWLIDHGAALYFHHNWAGVDEARINAPFAPIAQHVLLPLAGDIAEADARLRPQLADELLREIVDVLPEALLMDTPEGTTPPFESAEANRQAYLDYLAGRLHGPRPFVETAIRAQAALREAPQQTLSYRR